MGDVVYGLLRPSRGGGAVVSQSEPERIKTALTIHQEMLEAIKINPVRIAKAKQVALSRSRQPKILSWRRRKR